MAFIEFRSEQEAREAVNYFNNSYLDTFRISVEIDRKGSDKISTKLHVKNLAFEATEEELRHIFSPFGQIKGLRLPKRNFGQHAGYAFVEFMTKQEASNAKKALSSTHLYGRHLMIEWAKDDNRM